MLGVGRGLLTGHKGQGQNPQGRDAHVAGIGDAVFGARCGSGRGLMCGTGGVCRQMMHLARDFEGNWTLHRSIRDRLIGQHATLDGQAVFTATDKTHLTYEETGLLELEGGTTLQAMRRYFWSFTPEAITVAFDDGRPFHAFIPTGHAAGTDHRCGDDLYTVRYDFTAWPLWTAAWTVQGPRKDYVSISHYAPAP